MSTQKKKERVPDLRVEIARRLLFVVLSLALLVPGQSRAQVAPIGLSEVGAQWFGNEDLLVYVPESSDRFAYALAAGDFNGDGAEDLATGIPYDNGLVGSGLTNCGAVVVRYGVAGSGLAGGLADTILSQFAAGSLNPPESDDRFGYALAAGDFNGDGIDDLAIGVPGDRQWDDKTQQFESTGAVEIHYGLASGIQSVGEHHLMEGTFSSHNGDRMGEALAVGNFNGDSYDDLAIGIPGDHLFLSGGFVWPSGSVLVLHGHFGGLVPLDGYFVSQNSIGIPDVSELDDEFGQAVAAGDFNGDGFSDLAIGVPQEDDAGAVHVIFGSSFGLIYANNEFFGQGDLGGLPEAGDRFGQALAVGDFDGDGYDDLVIGDPREDLGPSNAAVDAGAITVVYGDPARFDYSRTGIWWQGNVYDNGAYDQTGDQFGWALAAGDFDGDGRDDLAVGHPGEDVLGGNDGAVTVLMGAPGFGLVGRFRFLSSGFLGIPGFEHQHNQDFGRALAVGDFDGSGFADLAIGVPYHDEPGFVDVGGEVVLYGALFADGFEIESPIRWSSVGQ